MLEVILLITGIFKAFQRPKLKRLTIQDFPNVDPQKFSEWHQAQLGATDAFLWATWGAFVIKIGILIALSGSRYSQETGMAITIVILVLWLIGLVISGVMGSSAKKLRIDAGINWPVPQSQVAQGTAATVRYAPTTPPVSKKTKLMRMLFVLLGILLLFVIGMLLRK